MILPEVNVAISAFDEHAEQHAVYAKWFNDLRSSGEELLLPGNVLSGFLRIIASYRIYQLPALMDQALALTTALRRAAGSEWSKAT